MLLASSGDWGNEDLDLRSKDRLTYMQCRARSYSVDQRRIEKMGEEEEREEGVR